jgi:hypothetical protein
MAKLSQVLRDQRRKKLIAKHAAKRAELRAKLRDPNVSMEEKFQVQKHFAKLPRNSCPTRLGAAARVGTRQQLPVRHLCACYAGSPSGQPRHACRAGEGPDEAGHPPGLSQGVVRGRMRQGVSRVDPHAEGHQGRRRRGASGGG